MGVNAMIDIMKTPKSIREAVRRYDKAHTTSLHLKLNLKTDADVLAALDASGNKQGYVKRLIREDIARPSTPAE